MTVSLNLANVANAISSLNISGVTVKDKDEVVGTWTSLPNVLYPKPDEWITNFSIRYDSVMQGVTAPMTIFYTLNYRFLGVRAGDISIFPVAYSDLVEKIITIVNAIIGLHAPYSGRVQLKIAGVSIGPRTDPAGNNFFGADFALSVEEMQN